MYVPVPFSTFVFRSEKHKSRNTFETGTFRQKQGDKAYGKRSITINTLRSLRLCAFALKGFL
jgi:hypothetical protein